MRPPLHAVAAGYARIDGRCFSAFTRGMDRPFDPDMVSAMGTVTSWLVEETQAVIGYTQSDEINLAWYSPDPKTRLFFDAKIQKMVSILAAMATAKFNQLALCFWPDRALQLPVFDCRVFQLPTKTELANAFLWREQDATKNAISMAARHYYSHRELQGKSGNEMQEMLFQKVVNFNDYPAHFKRGTFFQRRKVKRTLTTEELERIPERFRPTEPLVERSQVCRLEMPAFTKVTNRVGVIFDAADPCLETS